MVKQTKTVSQIMKVFSLGKIYHLPQYFSSYGHILRLYTKTE